MNSVGDLVNAFGWPGAMLLLLIGVLYVAFRKLNQLGTPFVLSQIEYTKSQKDAMESQAKSIEMQAHSVKAIENTLKMMAVGISQILDAGKGASNEQVEELKFNFRKLEDHVLQQDTALGLVPKEKSESITDPKLRMEPMQSHAEKADMDEQLDVMKEEIKEDAKEPEDEAK